MHPSETDYMALSYRSDLRLLFLRWRRPASPAEHRAGYQAALQLAQKEQAGCWLIDLRSRGLADPKDLQWVLQEFRADFQVALPTTTRRLAYLTTPYHAEVLRPRLAELDTVANTGTDIRVFTEEMPAQQWLQSGNN
ncbi:hypothetical protein HMJ29_07480 [Hymenobacter taeanensis]|uniref:STAS/SEC14 domain-containing protein n=1 Tax=Hymenobacter taeanensis TaxID=2735321 RepID=A0A6M6BG20_9BACT|nr:MULTISPECIES: hypothetical protein [Hymenobacter]QJX46788.1 hypothetical protein HMJ29_07480 [Hymenobacter taeanensis]UOQ80657.1 hypothetical protein MUN83_17825 [Hymenobacter sp. 5414T-23]